MSSVLGSDAGDPHARVAGVAALFVGAAAAAALAVLVWVLGYVGSLPFGAAPGADPQQASNLYLPLAVVWAIAAAVAVVSAIVSRTRPLAATILALAALAAGFAAPPLLAPAGDGTPAVLLGLLAWLVPACALALGLIVLAPRIRSGVKA